MTEIVVATLTSAEPADRPGVFLGGVAVPAKSILLERRPRKHVILPNDPPSLIPPRVPGDAQDVVLEIRAEPRDVDNGATAEITKREAKPWSAARVGDDPSYGRAPDYADTAGSGTYLWLEPVPGGEVRIVVGDAQIPVSEHAVVIHRDEILTFATELIALASRGQE